MIPGTVPSYSRPNSVPTPRMIIAQFDFLYPLEILKPLRAAVLKDLEKLVHSANRACFFTVYMTIFILLNLVSQTCQDDRRRQTNVGQPHLIFAVLENAYVSQLYARSASPAPKTPVRYHLAQFVEEIQRGALVILCHWHYYKGQDQVLGSEARNLPLTPDQTALYIDTSKAMMKLRENGS